MTRPTPVWPVGAILGEGPVWLEGVKKLMFVDIKQGHLHSLDPVSGERETIMTGGQPSFIVPATGSRLLVGSNDAVHELVDGRLERRICTIDMPAHNRTNDATVDPSGRLWFGTMDDEERRPSGALYCLMDGKLTKKGGEAIVTNGPAITGDGRTLYHVDSAERSIWRYPIDDAGELGQGDLFLRLGEEEGYPDGVVLDCEDCLWVALWEGWGVRRYAPSGALLQEVPFPCARVTKIAFGGADLRTAYATTARIGLSGGEAAEQPLAGALFAFDAPAAGRAIPSVSLR